MTQMTHPIEGFEPYKLKDLVEYRKTCPLRILGIIGAVHLIFLDIKINSSFARVPHLII